MQFRWECSKKEAHKSLWLTYIGHNSGLHFVKLVRRSSVESVYMDVLDGGGFWHAACHRPVDLFDKVSACELNCLPGRHISSNDFVHRLGSFISKRPAIHRRGEGIIEILAVTLDDIILSMFFSPIGVKLDLDRSSYAHKVILILKTVLAYQHVSNSLDQIGNNFMYTGVVLFARMNQTNNHLTHSPLDVPSTQVPEGTTVPKVSSQTLWFIFLFCTEVRQK